MIKQKKKWEMIIKIYGEVGYGYMGFFFLCYGLKDYEGYFNF